MGPCSGHSRCVLRCHTCSLRRGQKTVSLKFTTLSMSPKVPFQADSLTRGGDWGRRRLFSLLPAWGHTGAAGDTGFKPQFRKHPLSLPQGHTDSKDRAPAPLGGDMGSPGGSPFPASFAYCCLYHRAFAPAGSLPAHSLLPPVEPSKAHLLLEASRLSSCLCSVFWGFLSHFPGRVTDRMHALVGSYPVGCPLSSQL